MWFQNTKCCSMEIQNVFPWKVKLVLVKSKFRTGQQWLVVKRVIVNTDCTKGHCEHWLYKGSLWTLTADQLWKISFTQHWFSGQISFTQHWFFGQIRVYQLWKSHTNHWKSPPVVGWHFCPAKMSPYKATDSRSSFDNCSKKTKLALVNLYFILIPHLLYE